MLYGKKYFNEQLMIFDLLIQRDSFLLMQNFSKSFIWKKHHSYIMQNNTVDSFRIDEFVYTFRNYKKW